MKLTFALTMLAFMLFVQLAVAAIPENISYQGVLTNAGGTPVADGPYNLTFSIYDVPTSGTALWSETHSSVPVANGVFDVILGFTDSLDLPFNKPYWLGVSIDGGLELTPRTQLTPAPYSLNARSVADDAVTTPKIADSAIIDSKIASGEVVKSINMLKDDVTLAAGANVTIIPGGNTLTISSSATGTSDWGLMGNAGTTPGINFLGTTDEQALELRVNGARALRLEPDANCPNIIGGLAGNSINTGVYGATIAGGGETGGYMNKVTDNFGTVSGGKKNLAGNTDGTTDNAEHAVVAGGYGNVASNSCATAGGGYSNTASGLKSTVAGGNGNEASNDYSTVSGGYGNHASGKNAAMGGGINNEASGESATVSGGGGHQATAKYSTIGGGYDNAAIDIGTTVGGGGSNEANQTYATVSGGWDNTAMHSYSAVGGGFENYCGGHHSTISGGSKNESHAGYATVSGGYANRVNADYGTISGGGRSDPETPTTGNLVRDKYGTIGGGGNNKAGNFDEVDDNKPYATVGGGHSNEASGGYSTIPGGNSNTASGDYSFAAGNQAKALHDGCFVWGDSTASDIESTYQNQFIVRATEGVWFGDNSSPSLPTGKFINTSTGGYLSEVGVWTSVSDRNLKENFTQIDKSEVLERLVNLPITSWNFKNQDPSIRHLGPVAQDFYSVFGVGDDNKHICPLDADGVALTAIQELYQLVKDKDSQIVNLENRNKEQQKQIAEMEERLKALEALMIKGIQE